jgi:hypothetical protein
LLRSSGGSFIASTWYSATATTLDLNFNDGRTHQFALYQMDWDHLGRQQTVEIVDAPSGTVIDTRTVSAFSPGQYLVWRLRGHVLIRVTRTAGPNAVISGFFFDAALTSSPPVVTLTNPTAVDSYTAPASITVRADATDSDGSVVEVSFFAGTTPLGTVPGPAGSNSYEVAWNNVAQGRYTLTAKATDNTGEATVSAPRIVDVAGASGGGGPSAAFITSDVATKGSWKGIYGSQGYTVPVDGSSYPATTQVALAGQSQWTWALTTDIRALQRPATAERLAATWYSSGTFTFDINLADGLAHQIALYSLDWDNLGRAQRVEILDAGSGAVLDTRTLSNLSGGQYHLWRVRGHVSIRVTCTAGANAVAGGLFVDP